MARILSLILSTILVSSSLVQAKKKGLFPHPHRYPTSSTIGFVPTAVKLDLEECYGNNWQNDVVGYIAFDSAEIALIIYN